MTSIQVGDKVKWNWGNGFGEGEVKHRYTKAVTIRIDGTEVTRNGSEEEPAFLIEQDDGDEVLKLCTEISPVD